MRRFLRRSVAVVLIAVAFGAQAASASASPPSAPQNVMASPASGQAQVSWSAPSSDGGSQITGYTITPYIGSTAQTPTTAGASASSAVLTGLTNGTSYTFTVTASNSAGAGPASAASNAVTPEDTIFDFSGSPQLVDSGDGSSVELGVEFTADSDGSVTGIRFYKAAANTGTHVGSLWSASGQLLASATFTGETASGWQTVSFSSPVTITANTTYVAGYFAPAGHYSATVGGFDNAVTNGPLQALANSTAANGLYSYSSSSTFPTSSYQASNYWVDVLYAPATTPGQPTGVSATAQPGGASVSWSAPSAGGPATRYTITPYIGSTAQATTTVSGAPAPTSATITGLTAGTSYTFTVTAANTAGSGPASAPSNAVTPTGGGNPPSAPQNVMASPASGQAQVSWSAPSSDGGSQITGYTITPYIGSSAQTPVQVSNGSATADIVTGLTNGTSYTFTVTASNSAGAGPASAASNAATPEDTIFDFSATPQTVDSGDSSSVELGVEFTASQAGSVTGIRFYKAAANTGTHIGSLWSASGQLLASATFTGETASGWQTVSFSSPVQISANTTYVAGYFAPAGHYSATVGGLDNAVTNGPLQALANSTAANGLYSYSSSSTFPTSTYNANNYWVDVLYAPANTSVSPGQPTNVTATAGPQSATVSWMPPATGGTATSYTITPYDAGSAQPPTTVSGTSTSTTVTGLIPDEEYTFTVTGSNAAGSGPASVQSNEVDPTAATAPSAPQNVTASPATNQALVSWSAPSDGGDPITGYTITPYVNGSAQTPTQVSDGSATSGTVTGLTNGTSYTFTVTATNQAGTSAASSASAAVTPEFTIFDFSSTPQTVDSGDSSGVELGVQFTADVNGQVTGIRFYKAAANTGTHIGSLWSASGQLLASATFTGETASGWQTVSFANPVSITAGTTYVAGYFAPNGHYSATPQGLVDAVDNGPLEAEANSTAADGVYSYGNTSTFPTSTYNATNYWVDVLFATSATNAPPGQPSGVSASPGYQTATVSWSVPWDGGSPITGYTITPYVGGTPQTPVQEAASSTTATVTGLSNGTSYTFTVSATNANGTGEASAASNAVTPGPQPEGVWSPLMNWPLVAVHSVLLDDGNVLTWDAWQQPAPTQEFDPSTGAFTNPIDAPDGLFCSAMAQMPNGDILVVGGYGELSTGNLGIVDTNIYDPATSTWTRVADMHFPRWYAGLTELADGDYVVISGKTTDFSSWADTPEVYDPTANTWTELTNVDTSAIHELEYPNTYLIPNGNVFVLGPQEDTSYELNVPDQTWTQVGGSSGVVNGASVMYRPGQILYAGGAASLASPSDAQANAATIDLNSSSPQWQTIAPMSYPRAFENLQMLADGTVLAIGGEPVTGQQNGQGEVSGGVLPSEIWNPSTGQWTTVASMAATRGYHTSTLLMPDGRVLVAGSGHAAPGEPGQYSAQYYSPPYLFNGARPTITGAPSSATYGSNITVTTPDAASIKAVNLVDLGTSTHQMDFSQHFVPLSFTAGSGSLSVQMPANGNYAPPANYMLFIINSAGVPSVASIINLSASGGGGPEAVTDVTAAPLTSTSAQVNWLPASDPHRAVTSYTVTAYRGSQQVASKTVTGSPTPVRTTIGGLAAGGTYTFRVKASDRITAGPASRASNPVKLSAHPPPRFVQKASAYADTTADLPITLGSPVAAGDRLIVAASIWGRGAGATDVTDSSGDHFTELLNGVAADSAQTSIWTAPIRAGTAHEVVTVASSGVADVGAVALEYSGLSTARGAMAIDRIVAAGGTTGKPAIVDSGPTQPARAGDELALGVYADSGYGDELQPGRGFSERAVIGRTRTMMEQLVEDRVVSAGATPDASVHTGASTPWIMATIVFRGAAFRAPTAHGPRAAAILARMLPKLPPPGGLKPPSPGPVIPLSRRRRPHPVAGAIAEFVGRLPDGQLVHYYCLLGPGGHEIAVGPPTGSSWTLSAPPLP